MYFLRPMIITAIAVFTGSTILILLVLLVFMLLKKANVSLSFCRMVN